MHYFIIPTLLAFLAIAAIEVPFIYQQKKWKEVILFSAIWSIALVLSILQIVGLDIPTPILLIKNILNR